MWPGKIDPLPIPTALAAIDECLALASDVGDAALEAQTALGALSALFLARAGQSLYSSGLLSQCGLIADALSVGRTVVEMAIDYGYIAQSPTERIPKFESYNDVSRFKLADNIAKHKGLVPAEAMRVLRERHDTAKLTNPDSEHNWAGVSISRRARDTERETFYDLPYREMCEASHSCYGTLEYALVGLDESPAIHFGTMAPNARPVTLTVGAMALLIGTVVQACGFEARFAERALALPERMSAASAAAEAASTPDE